MEGKIIDKVLIPYMVSNQVADGEGYGSQECNQYISAHHYLIVSEGAIKTVLCSQILEVFPDPTPQDLEPM